jgi:hypothetical protein
VIPVGKFTLAFTPPGLAVKAAFTASRTEGVVPVLACVIVASSKPPPLNLITVLVAEAAITPLMLFTPKSIFR